jgi:hypothetical protein
MQGLHGTKRINVLLETKILPSEKGTFVPVLNYGSRHEDGGVEAQFHIYLTSGLDGGEVSFTPQALYPDANWI